MSNIKPTMASKYSQKTTITFYKFESEEDYRIWLNANCSRAYSEFHDIMALVKNPMLNNGYDIFFNGHSLSKSTIYIKRGDEIIEVTDSSECFSSSKQYLLKNFSRKGQGQKNIIVLEEFDLEKLVTETTDHFIKTDETFQLYVENTLRRILAEEYEPHIEEVVYAVLNDFIEHHNETHDNINSVLSNAHNSLRKVFSILHRRKQPNLQLGVNYIDNEGKIRNNLGLYIKVASIKYIQLNIQKYEGLDLKYNYAKFYLDDNTTPFLTLDGKKIGNGLNQPILYPFFLNKDTKIKCVLNITNRFIDDNEVDDPKSFDKEINWKEETKDIINTTYFYIEQEPTDTENPFGYTMFVPMVSEGRGEYALDDEFRLNPNFETLDWMLGNAVAKFDGPVYYLLTEQNEHLQFSDGGFILTADLKSGEYILQNSRIFNYVFTSPNLPTTKTIKVPRSSSEANQIYTIVPNANCHSVKFNEELGSLIETKSIEGQTYSLFKKTTPTMGETTLKTEILS